MADTSITLSGPLFDRGDEAVRTSVTELVKALALILQRKVQQQMVPGHGVRTGAARRDVQTGLVSWDEANTFTTLRYWKWLESGPSGKQHPGSFSGYGFFDAAVRQVAENDAEVQAAAQRFVERVSGNAG